MAPERLPKSSDGFNSTRTQALLGGVLVASLLFGLFGLPRVGGSRAVGIGKLAEDFSLPVVAGGDPTSRVSLSALRGKVVVLDFWATWCAPCTEQTKVLERFVAAPHGDVVVLGVNEGESAEQLREHFERRRAPAYTIVSDVDEAVGQGYGVTGLPTLVTIDRDGKIRSVVSGVVPDSRLERLVAEASAR